LLPRGWQRDVLTDCYHSGKERPQIVSTDSLYFRAGAILRSARMNDGTTLPWGDNLKLVWSDHIRMLCRLCSCVSLESRCAETFGSIRHNWRYTLSWGTLGGMGKTIRCFGARWLCKLVRTDKHKNAYINCKARAMPNVGSSLCLSKCAVGPQVSSRAGANKILTLGNFILRQRCKAHCLNATQQRP